MGQERFCNWSGLCLVDKCSDHMSIAPLVDLSDLMSKIEAPNLFHHCWHSKKNPSAANGFTKTIPDWQLSASVLQTHRPTQWSRVSQKKGWHPNNVAACRAKTGANQPFVCWVVVGGQNCLVCFWFNHLQQTKLERWSVCRSLVYVMWKLDWAAKHVKPVAMVKFVLFIVFDVAVKPRAIWFDAHCIPSFFPILRSPLKCCYFRIVWFFVAQCGKGFRYPGPALAGTEARCLILRAVEGTFCTTFEVMERITFFSCLHGLKFCTAARNNGIHRFGFD